MWGNNLACRPCSLSSFRCPNCRLSSSLARSQGLRERRIRAPAPTPKPPASRTPSKWARHGSMGVSPTNGNNLKSSPETVSAELTSLLEEFGLAEVPSNADEGHGVMIDRNGQLQIIDQVESEKAHKTALFLSVAPKSLSTRDFANLFERGKHLRGWRAWCAEQIIPMRSDEDMHYEEAWILIFRNPMEAQAYQHRAHRLRALARQVLPESPTSGIQLPASFSSGAPHGFVVQDYTLTSPWQWPAFQAYLHPFPKWMQAAIDLHQNMLSSSRQGLNGYPVRVWVDEQHAIPLNEELLKKLITWDGRVRSTHWHILETEGAYTRLTGRLQHELLDEDTVIRKAVGPRPMDSWRILFENASDARRFVRVWNRRQLPDHLPLNLDSTQQPLLKAECLFDDYAN